MNCHKRLCAPSDLHVRVTDFAATHRGYRRRSSLPSSRTAPQFEGHFPRICGVEEQEATAIGSSYRNVFLQV
jgi:hypothetical protein